MSAADDGVLCIWDVKTGLIDSINIGVTSDNENRLDLVLISDHVVATSGLCGDVCCMSRALLVMMQSSSLWTHSTSLITHEWCHYIYPRHQPYDACVLSTVRCYCVALLMDVCTCGHAAN